MTEMLIGPKPPKTEARPIGELQAGTWAYERKHGRLIMVLDFNRDTDLVRIVVYGDVGLSLSELYPTEVVAPVRAPRMIQVSWE